MIEKIDISNPSIAEEVRKQMAVATATEKGLLPSGKLVATSYTLEPNASFEIRGSKLVYIDVGGGGFMILVSFAYWDYTVINGSLLNAKINIAYKAANLFEVKSVSNNSLNIRVHSLT